jgi:hypothetical protein
MPTRSPSPKPTPASSAPVAAARFARASLALEGDELVRTAPRTLLIDQFCHWLTEEDTAGGVANLPDGDVIVGIDSRLFVAPPFGSGRSAVGVFGMVRDDRTAAGGRRANDRWEVRVAYGDKLPDAPAVTAWLATLPQTLLRLARFSVAHHGRVPSAVSADELQAWSDQAVAEGDAVAAAGRAIVDRFVAAHPTAVEASALLDGVAELRRSPGRARPKGRGLAHG